MGKKEDQEEGLYGRWQTQPYVPPPIVNGKIPKNEFGNVYFFDYNTNLLPAGTIHLEQRKEKCLSFFFLFLIVNQS